MLNGRTVRKVDRSGSKFTKRFKTKNTMRSLSPRHEAIFKKVQTNEVV